MFRLSSNTASRVGGYCKEMCDWKQFSLAHFPEAGKPHSPSIPAVLLWSYQNPSRKAVRHCSGLRTARVLPRSQSSGMGVSSMLVELLFKFNEALLLTVFRAPACVRMCVCLRKRVKRSPRRRRACALPVEFSVWTCFASSVNVFSPEGYRGRRSGKNHWNRHPISGHPWFYDAPFGFGFEGWLPAGPLELSSLAANLGEMKVTKLSCRVCRGGKARWDGTFGVPRFGMMELFSLFPLEIRFLGKFSISRL